MTRPTLRVKTSVTLTLVGDPEKVRRVSSDLTTAMVREKVPFDVGPLSTQPGFWQSSWKLDDLAAVIEWLAPRTNLVTKSNPQKGKKRR